MHQLSQEAAVLQHLSQGKTLSPIEALELFGCFRLASVIHELRKLGYDIETLDGITHRNGKKKHYAIYKLIKAPANDLFSHA